jgi:hypothetical protein
VIRVALLGIGVFLCAVLGVHFQVFFFFYDEFWGTFGFSAFEGVAPSPFIPIPGKFGGIQAGCSSIITCPHFCQFLRVSVSFLLINMLGRMISLIVMLVIFKTIPFFGMCTRFA